MSCYVLGVVWLYTYFIVAADSNGRGNQLLLLHNNAKEITLLDLHTNQMQTITSSDVKVVAMDYDLARNLLFWATHSKIYRCALKGGCVAEQVAEVGGVGGITVDWVHNRLYWTAPEVGQVEVARFNGSARQVLYRDGQPRDIAVDPIRGKLFWIDNQSTPYKIRYANLDGTYHKQKKLWEAAPVLWKADRLNPESFLALDVETQDLYFNQIERGQTTVMVVNYHLKKNRVAVNIWNWSSSMAVLQGRVYWSNSSAVYWTPDGGNEVNIVSKHLRNIERMKSVSPKLQPTTADVCEANMCEQECFMVNDHPVCACRFGHSLKADEKTCNEDGYAVLFTPVSIYRVTLPLDTEDHHSNIQLLFYNRGSQICAVDVHVHYNLIFWSDIEDHAIYVASMERPSDRQLLVKSVAKSLTVDWLHDHLYWTEGTRVHMSTIDGKLTVVVAEEPHKPLSVVVDPINRLLFWSTCNWKMMIVKAALDGSNRNELVTKDITCATSLCASTGQRRLNWLDFSRSTASSIYYDGRTRHNIYEPRAVSLAVFGDKLIWTSSRDQALFVNQSSWTSKVPVGLNPHGVVVYSRSRQLGGPNYCQDSDCQGMCVSGLKPGSWTCVCPQGLQLSDDNITCLTIQQEDPQAFVLEPNKLWVLDYDSSSVQLNCSRILYAQNYIITLQLNSSFSRKAREDWGIKVATSDFPVTVTGLQPATTYSVTVEPHPTYLGVLKTEVSTPPPHQHMTRLTEVYKPWDSVPVRWIHKSIDFYDVTLPWESLVRELFLLQFPQIELTQMKEVDSQVRPKALLDRIRQQLAKMGVRDKFIVLAHYKNKVAFDRDSRITLWNTPFEVKFYLAMVQVSEYNSGYGVDIIRSETTRISWPVQRQFGIL